MRIACLLFFSLFLWSCYLQLNDPDPAIWIVLYGFAAFLTALAFFGRVYHALSTPVIVSYVIYAVVLIPAPHANYINDEEAREALGLLIIAAWLGWLSYWKWRQPE